jgi:hypothetical protein
MNIIIAVKRLGWRFQQTAESQNRTMKLNQNDLNALQSIAIYVERTQKQQFENNDLFAKMYIFCYMRILEKNKTTVLETYARRKLYDFLNLPISSIVEKFTDYLNDQEVENLFNEQRIKTKHPAILTEREKTENVDKIIKAIEHPENFQRFTRKVWDYEKVKNCLEIEVNQAINRLNLHPNKN